MNTADVPGELPSDVTDVPADEASADEASADEGTSDASEDGGALCASQDARADGPCAAELPGIVWDGTHCRSLGSGCSCVGEDCDEVYDTWTECVTARSSCYGATCEPQEAAGRMCDGGGCAIVLGSFWDGRACFDAIGCECAGADCAAGFASPEECVAVHAGCDGSLCGDTGGQWFPAAAGFCGFSCGVANPITCESPFDSCRCEAGRTFLPGSGCVEEVAGCDAALLCQATEGEWNPGCACPFVCGEELPECYACGDQCNCGPYRRFDADLGCVPEPTCAGTDCAAVCTSTGGTWHDCSPGDPWCSCGDYCCGRPNLT